MARGFVVSNIEADHEALGMLFHIIPTLLVVMGILSLVIAMCAGGIKHRRGRGRGSGGGWGGAGGAGCGGGGCGGGGGGGGC